MYLKLFFFVLLFTKVPERRWFREQAPRISLMPFWRNEAKALSSAGVYSRLQSSYSR